VSAQRVVFLIVTFAFLAACAGLAAGLRTDVTLRPPQAMTPTPEGVDAGLSVPPHEGWDGGLAFDAGPAGPVEELPLSPLTDNTLPGPEDGGFAPKPPSAAPDRTQPPWSQTLIPPLEVGQVEKDVVAGGRHWRIGTEHGVIHVWRPAGYRASTAGMVLYVHGYFTNVDQAWTDHRLAEQFRDSQMNALFIAPEAPSWFNEDVSWKELQALLQKVSHVIRLKLPEGPIVATVHSGGYRTLQAWLDHEKLDCAVMLDAMYGPTDPYQAWLTQGERAALKRFIMVTADTEPRARELLRKHPSAVKRTDLPKKFTGFTLRQRHARVLYLKAEGYDHMEVVTKGVVLPLVLRLTPLRRL